MLIGLNLRRGIRSILLLSLAFVLCAYPARAQESNPLINPQEIEYVETEHEYLNILLAGIDFGRKGYLGSYRKTELLRCHADAMLVIAMDKTDGSVDLISLPRDSLTYVPGVRGIYKLNGAVNCGDTLEEGLERACATASWLLGGVEVSQYCAVDMNTMIALGDAIGGVEFNMDMAYSGHSGRKYVMGWQHLDGVGIMDYLRARTNATRNGSDIGRTGRHRELMLAIFAKIRDNPALVMEILKVMQDPEQLLVTSFGLSDVLSLAGVALKVQPENIGSYVLTGPYMSALGGWNFTFTHQANRQQVLREVFGIHAQELPYVSKRYCAWLEETGFTTARYLGSARQILAYAQSMELDRTQKQMTDAFGETMEEVAALFSVAADTLNPLDQNAMERARKVLRSEGIALMEALGYTEPINWLAGPSWYEDARINEYQYEWQ